MTVDGGAVGGSPMGFAQQMAEMRRTASQESKIALVESNAEIRKKMLRLIDITEPGLELSKRHKSIQDQILRSRLSSPIGLGERNVNDAIDEMEYSSMASRRTRAWGSGVLGGTRAAVSTVFRGASQLFSGENITTDPRVAAKNRGNLFSDFLRFGTPEGKSAEQLRAEMKNRPIDQEVPGYHPDPVKQRYGFTSFSGLAEQMQAMWSGTPGGGKPNDFGGAVEGLKDAARALSGLPRN